MASASKEVNVSWMSDKRSQESLTVGRECEENGVTVFIAREKGPPFTSIPWCSSVFSGAVAGLSDGKG